jgi:thiol-disulfide isomerase/thioredoxin/outer membrane lipoprotein-sorting protein
MSRRVLVCLGFWFVVFPTDSFSQSSDNDALKLLDEVAKQYQTATSYHIESVTEQRNSSELSSYWSKQFVTAYEAPGNRYRFEGRARSEEGLVVSDGTTEWEFHPIFAQYVKRPAGSYGHPFPAIVSQSDSRVEREAFFMRKNLTLTGASLKSAHFLPEETITIGSRTVTCIVVEYSSDDFRSQSPGSTTKTKTWIDKGKKTIVKTFSTTDSLQPWTPKGPPPNAIPSHAEITVTYPVVTLNEPIPETVFIFTPPSDTALVEAFPDPMRDPAYAAIPAKLPKVVGMIAPKLVFRDTDGSTLDLATLRGKPVLLDLWATWCTPCLEEMPVIDRIFKSTKQAGLTVIGVDQDEHPADATAFLRRKDYGWKNYHTDEKNLHIAYTGIPFVVLIDTDGKIAYAHSGNDDDKGLITAIKKLGPAFEVALSDTK